MRTRLARFAAALVLALAGLVSSSPASAQSSFQIPIESQGGDLRVPIGTEIRIPVPDPSQVPGSTEEKRTQYLMEGRVEDLAQYIGIIYNFLISIVGLVAASMMIVGGFQYLTSAGDSSKIGAAKSRMANAFIGMILALGAYTILNTINPALLRLKLADLRTVSAITFFWPWCDQVVERGFEVRQLQGTDECGAVGEYRLTTTATTTGPCVYRGANPDFQVRPAVPKVAPQTGTLEATDLQNKQDGKDGTEAPKEGEEQLQDISGGASGGKVLHSCLQRGGLDANEILETAKKENAFRAAYFVPCAAITSEVAKVLGYTTLGDACKAWFDTTYAWGLDHNKREMEAAKPGDWAHHDSIVWSYCAPAKSRDTCVQSDIYCRYVDRNEDDGPGDCSDGENDCGCEGYDESPDVAFTQDAAKVTLGLGGGTWELPAYITIDGGGPEDYSYHLGPICAWNPCRDYVGYEGKSNFKNGCKGPGISTFVWGVRAFTADCRNK